MIDPKTVQPMPEDEEPIEAEAEDESGQRLIYPPPAAPYRVARKLYGGYTVGRLLTLRAWRGCWMRWKTTHWAEIDAAELREYVYDVLDQVDYEYETKDGIEVRQWNPSSHKIRDVLEAMAAYGHLSTEIDPPTWIDVVQSAEQNADRMVSCTNGLLDLSTRELSEHTPALFNLVSVPFAYDAKAPVPKVWFKFLKSVWGDDAESVALLQEYIGYVLSGRLDMQKMLMLLGPTRSGKGTIARMLKLLIGKGHVVGPTLASLGTNFGLAPLVGKPLAIVSDARLGSTGSNIVVERLLSITGEDTLTFDRKYREAWSAKLPTRFIVISNELPKFRDSSGAIANRMLILRMTKSFLGKEDRTLDARLAEELPGILNWALKGLARLNKNTRFTVPKSSDDTIALMMDLASPMSAFVRECCTVDPQASVARDDLYHEYRQWCVVNGHNPVAKPTFGRDLHSVVPELGHTQPRIGGTRPHTYTNIGLSPVPPVPDDDDEF